MEGRMLAEGSRGEHDFQSGAGWVKIQLARIGFTLAFGFGFGFIFSC